MSAPILSGTIVPLVTPFAADEAFDPEAMRALIRFVLREGADGLMPSALTGEGPLLRTEEILDLWEVVFNAAGAVAVVPAIISTTTRAAMELARRAESMGARAIMAAPILPELYTGRNHQDVFGFYADVAGVTGLPLILFNYPSLTGVDLTPQLVARLSEIASVRYIKESSGDVRRVHAIQRLLGGRIEVICGAPNTALESLALGSRAWITGLMNALPKTAQQLMRAVHALNDLELARRVYYRQLLPLVDELSRVNKPTATIKASLTLRGVPVGVPRRPSLALEESDLDRLKQVMASVLAYEQQTEAEMSARARGDGAKAI